MFCDQQFYVARAANLQLAVLKLVKNLRTIQYNSFTSWALALQRYLILQSKVKFIRLGLTRRQCSTMEPLPPVKITELLPKNTPRVQNDKPLILKNDLICLHNKVGSVALDLPCVHYCNKSQFIALVVVGIAHFHQIIQS